MLEWQDDRSKMALQLNLSCHELANDTNHAYVTSNTTAAMDWIGQKRRCQGRCFQRWNGSIDDKKVFFKQLAMARASI